MDNKEHAMIEKACENAFEKFQQLKNPEYSEIQSKLEYVLGSYRYDGNPVGLYEVGGQALEVLKEHKKAKTRQISKKLIDDMEKAIATQEN
jgi:hypothetical protein